MITFKNRVYFLTIFVILTFFLLRISYGQISIKNKDCFNNNESFLLLPKGKIKNEIASFNIKGSDSLKNIFIRGLEEIPLKRCSDSFAYFEKGNIFSNECVVVIEADNSGDKPTIDGIYYSMYKYAYNFPDSAVYDIYYPKFCTEYTKKNKPISSNCKVFQTKDRKRIYIYMIAGEGKNRYEVTWIYQSNGYYGRVIDII